MLGLAVAALALRLALSGVAWVEPQRLAIEEDSVEYVTIARNLAAGHGFSRATEPPYEPDTRRTPVYPSLLAALFGLPRAGERAAAFAGVVASVLTVVATWRMAAALIGPAAAWWAALLLALDLTSAAYAAQILTEAFFTLLLVLSFLPLLDRDVTMPSALRAGTLSGLAALCRPIGVFAFAALAPLCRLRTRDAAGAIRLLTLAGFMAMALVAVWTMRNYRAGGTATVSSVAATNMYFHRAAYVEAWLQRRRVEDVRDDWERDFRARATRWSEAERVSWMNQYGRDLVLRHPFVYATVAAGGALRMLTPDHLVLAPLTDGEAGPVFRVLHAAAWVQLAVVYALAAAGLARLGSRSMLRLAVPLAPIAYFMLIGGPEMYPRFRVPLMPFICLIAAAGIAPEEV